MMLISKLKIWYPLLLAILIWPPHSWAEPAANGAPSSKEIALEEALARSLEAGQALWLNDNQNKFLAIFTPDQSGHPKGGVIILHDADNHPDWPDVIRPLRTFLPNHGWATIAIQLPQFETIDGYIAQQPVINSRIQKAVEQLHSAGFHNITLIGHGSGAMAACAYLASGMGDADIRGFVAISLNVIKSEKRDDYIPTQLEKIKLPILDIYGSRDLPTVTATAMARSQAAKRSSSERSNNQNLDAYKSAGLSKTANDAIKGYIAYRQIVIAGADHYFEDQGKTLSRRVLGWLDRHTSGAAITSKR